MFSFFRRKSKTKVIHKPSGYRGYMDQKPIRKPNWHMIFVLIGGLFSCGAVTTLLAVFTIPSLFSSPAPVPESIASTSEPTRPALVADVSTARPTLTQTPAPPTSTSPSTEILNPTQDTLRATVNAVSTNLARMNATSTPAPPTATPDATSTPAAPAATATKNYEQIAVVQFDNVIVRSGAGTRFREITMAWYGERYGLIDERYTSDSERHWYRIDVPGHNSAWIAARLARLEPAP
jgi:hypothetical protein